MEVKFLSPMLFSFPTKQGGAIAARDAGQGNYCPASSTAQRRGRQRA